VLLVTGSVDRSLRVWDLRFSANGPLQVLVGHGYAVKRLKCHPHAAGIVGSVSYDMTCCLWDAGPLPGLGPPPPPLPPVSESAPGGDAPVSPRGGPRGSGVAGFADRGFGRPVDYGGRGVGGGQLVARGDHREFATGLDFSLFAPDRLATCSWDRTVRIWDAPVRHLQ
jgi:peroxin-7